MHWTRLVLKQSPTPPLPKNALSYHINALGNCKQLLSKAAIIFVKEGSPLNLRQGKTEEKKHD